MSSLEVRQSSAKEWKMMAIHKYKTFYKIEKESLEAFVSPLP